MQMLAENEKLEKACQEAKDKFHKLGEGEYQEIISKLQYVIVSYNADKNPIGLYEIGEKALQLLKEHKKKAPRQVSKKLIDDLEKAIQMREN
ncbi:hypothetical protein AAG747_14155 [Rapidithrix thailandica]|uniref:Uncharacterized protein n=1 Tax=Rapidithrix thailandica TaxID=413964 RepID=A0AAW9SCJ8_9BACT